MKPWMFGQNTKTILEMFGERIRTTRKLRMITAEKLAHDSGIARSTLILIEKGAPGVGMGSYINVLITLGFERRLLEFSKTHATPPCANSGIQSLMTKKWKCSAYHL